MKMVNLKMSLIAALPPLGYGHFPTQVPPHLDQSVSGNKCWKYTHRLFIIVCDKFNRSFKTWKTGLFGGFFTWWKYVDASMERICWNLSTHAALTITIITGLKTLLMQSTVWKTILLFEMSIENIYNTLCDWHYFSECNSVFIGILIVIGFEALNFFTGLLGNLGVGNSITFKWYKIHQISPLLLVRHVLAPQNASGMTNITW